MDQKKNLSEEKEIQTHVSGTRGERDSVRHGEKQLHRKEEQGGREMGQEVMEGRASQGAG